MKLSKKSFDKAVLTLAKQYPDFRLFQVNGESTIAVLVIRENDRIADTYTVEKNKLVKNFGLFMCMFDRDYHDFSDDGKFDNCKWLYEPERKPEEKPKKVTPRKPRTRKPTIAKGNANAEIAEWVKANDLCTLKQAQEHGFTGKTRADLWNFKVDLGLRKGKR